MTHEIKTFAFEFETKQDDAGQMLVEGYGSTFGGDPDAYGDVVAKGAFKESLKTRMPKMLYQHHPHRIAGVWDEAKEDGKGLYLKGHFINTTLGRDAYEEARSGALDSMSIGFSCTSADYDEKKGTRTLKGIELYEVSLVTFPANSNALITGVKEAPKTIRELEEILRDAGLSRQQAKAVAAGGFKALDQRDAEDLTPILEQLKTLTNSLKDIHNA
ncbi:HK97 family phage prohead protease (plasmid) [Skermanella rosea]|uniref:HK97 family phage prohead protease n=1 Tax=Skermanella rosea TaxID=1817965 RepID=UPI001932BEF3|nr:HK97 family phage prohead protease [Skermanella rosea]UEM08073.1 HK97 family phage prohead protease [Skermanella rosea]